MQNAKLYLIVTCFHYYRKQAVSGDKTEVKKWIDLKRNED